MYCIVCAPESKKNKLGRNDIKTKSSPDESLFSTKIIDKFLPMSQHFLKKSWINFFIMSYLLVLDESPLSTRIQIDCL
jgi:hypothetical protein